MIGTIQFLGKQQGFAKFSSKYPSKMSASNGGEIGWNSPAWKHKVKLTFLLPSEPHLSSKKKFYFTLKISTY